ncbi:MAG: NACHT domain-containing protein [Labedaea sp.]
MVATIVCLTAFAIWLVMQFSQGDLDRGDKLASIVSMSVTVITLPLSVLAIVVTLRQGAPSRVVLTLADRLDAMAEVLAVSVRSQWEAEEQLRRVHDPFPLPARWTNAPDQLMDHWPSINGARDRPDPLVLDGEDIVETFDRIPSGRLVVLGRAGAGKTILTSRFVLTLLAMRPVPVPVLFTLGSWDPSTQLLRDWLAEQMIATYPILAERDHTGLTVATQLLNTGRLLPVLDGFDEISEGHRTAAITGINASLRPADRLLLTSRPEEYADAVQTGDVLTAAAVVRLDDLTLADAAGYLPLTTRRTEVHGGANKWATVLAHASPVLTDVLSTPLMVALARTIFSDTAADPGELLAVESGAEIEERLLTGFVPAVYAGTGLGARAGHQLGFLATHLRRLGTYELAWWQLALGVRRIAIGLLAGTILTVTTWLVTGYPALAGTLPDSVRSAWVRAAGVWGLLVGLSGGILVGYFRDIRPSPARMRPAFRGRTRQVAYAVSRDLRNRRSISWVGAWILGGLLFGMVAVVASGSSAGLGYAVAGGGVIGVVSWLVAATIRALGAPVEPTEVVSPDELIRTDRATAIREGATFGVCVSILLWLTVWLTFQPATGLSFNQTFGGGIWLIHSVILTVGATLIWMLLVTVSGSWLIARVWLPLTGRLPWHIMAFLADAHRRGVLRQTGGVYQFRHARLQDHLAQTSSPRSSIR